MSSPTLAAPPAAASIAIEQIRTVGLALRPVLIGASALLLLFAVVVLTEPARTGPVDLLPNRFGRLGLLVVLLAPAVWRHDEPGLRGYLLAMPVDRVRHQLVRSGAGWLWVMALVGATLGTFVMLTALTGGAIVVWQPGISLPSGGWDVYQEATSALDALGLQSRQPLPPWQWVVPFAAATVLFLLGNAVAIARTRAVLWILGPYVGYQLLASTMETRAPALHAWSSAIVHGRFGLETLLSGNVRQLVHTLQLSVGPAPIYSLRPDLAAWLGSVALWLLIALLATGLALRGNQRSRRAAAGA